MRISIYRIAIVLGVLAVTIGFFVARSYRKSESCKEFLAGIADSIELGENVKRAEMQLDSGEMQKRGINISQVKYRNNILVMTAECPLTFGAQNAVLVIYCQNNLIRGIGFRTADSLLIRPPRSSPDRVDPAFAPHWRQLFSSDNPD